MDIFQNSLDMLRASWSPQLKATALAAAETVNSEIVALEVVLLCKMAGRSQITARGSMSRWPAVT